MISVSVKALYFMPNEIKGLGYPTLTQVREILGIYAYSLGFQLPDDGHSGQFGGKTPSAAVIMATNHFFTLYERGECCC